jgi:hypothetical protein
MVNYRINLDITYRVDMNPIKIHIDIVINEMLRRISVTKRDEVEGGWRELHNEELHNLYSSPHIIRMIK